MDEQLGYPGLTKVEGSEADGRMMGYGLAKVMRYLETLKARQDCNEPVDEDILILGSYLHHSDSIHDGTALGFLLQDICPAVMTKLRISNQYRFDFCSEYQSYENRMTGFYNGHVMEAEPMRLTPCGGKPALRFNG
jgi:hypothetical protein